MAPEALEESTVEKAPAEAIIGLERGFVREVVETLDKGDIARCRELIKPLHAADLADLLEQISTAEREEFVKALGAEITPDTLSELDEAVRDHVVHLLEPEQLAAAISELDTDDAVYLLEDLKEEAQNKVLTEIPPEEQAALREALSYPEDSAGRLMQQDLIAVPEYWTVGQTIDHLRESEDLPDDFYEIIVVDPAYRPIGTVPLSHAMRAKRPTAVGDIMDRDPQIIPADMDQEEVAYLFQQYRLMSAPVVDASGRLLGVVMGDDIVDVVQEEAEEDILYLSGVQEGGVHESVVETTRTRFTWLLVNLGTAILASGVIALFDVTIEKLVALAVLMPIVASMGGNAGTQTLAVAVRALATRELTPANAWRTVNKEALVGLINGVLLAIVIGVLSGLWFQSVALGGVLAAAMVINLLVAALAGILIPMGLQKLDIDPAVASSVFVTTVTDVVGFFAFLGLAAWILF